MAMRSHLFASFFVILAYGVHTPPLKAQTVPTPSFPRYAVGANLFTGSYEIFYSDRHYENLTFNPAELTISYQFRPRLTAQLGLVWYRSSSYSDYSYTNAAGKFLARYYGGGSQSDIVIPVLGRYTLTNHLHRLQFDILGGLTYLHARFHSSGGYTDSLQVTTPHNINRTANNFILTLGPSVRCALGKHLEAVSDFTFNQSLSGRRAITSDNFNLTHSLSLGLRYRFGYR